MDTTRSAVSSFTQFVTVQHVSTTGVLTPVSAVLGYDCEDPYAVTVVFRTGKRSSTWTFGRDLLSEGMLRPTGDSDVRVWPCLDLEGRSVVMLELCSDDGEALVQLPGAEVAPFVRRMHEAVRPGDESDHVDVDAAIAAIWAVETV